MHEPLWDADQSVVWDRVLSTLVTLDDEADPDFVRLLDRCRLAKGSSGLDIGCGAGRHTVAAANRGYVMSAVDFSPGAIALAKNNLRNAGLNIHLQHASSHDLGFNDELFDFSFAWCVLNHGTRSFFVQSLMQSLRVIRSEGYSFGMVMSRTDPRYGCGERVHDHCFRFTEGPEAGVVHYFPSEPELRAALRSVGRILEFREVRYSDPDVGEYYPGLPYSSHYLYLVRKLPFEARPDSGNAWRIV